MTDTLKSTLNALLVNNANNGNDNEQDPILLEQFHNARLARMHELRQLMEVDLLSPPTPIVVEVRVATTQETPAAVSMETKQKTASSRSRSPVKSPSRSVINKTVTEPTTQGDTTDKERTKWKKSIQLPLAEILNHRHGPLFANAVKTEHVQHYTDCVRQPMDLSLIRTRIRDAVISTSQEFERDILLMCMNAIMFNGEDTPMNQFARDIMQFSMLKIKELYQTEKLVQVRRLSISSQLNTPIIANKSQQSSMIIEE